MMRLDLSIFSSSAVFIFTLRRDGFSFGLICDFLGSLLRGRVLDGFWLREGDFGSADAG